jgi:hypothetical protein
MNKQNPVTTCKFKDGLSMSEKILERSTGLGIPIFGLFIKILLFSTLAFQTANAADNPKPVFIRAVCEGKISSSILVSLREKIRTSQKYRLISTLDDDGRMDTVMAVYMNCAERGDVAAVATTYGQGKCVSALNCRILVEGVSIRSALCEAQATVECGLALFNAFDAYVNRGNPPR